jgi:hypothetical protein
MNYKDRLKHSKPVLHLFCLIFSFVLFVNLQTVHGQTTSGEILNTQEAKSNRETGGSKPREHPPATAGGTDKQAL